MVHSLLLLLLLPAALPAGPAAEYDALIRGGRVVDGTGNPAFHADVAIRDGRIAPVGRVAGKAKSEVDARALVLMPKPLRSQLIDDILCEELPIEDEGREKARVVFPR